MPLTQDALTADELDYLIFATLSEKVANRDEVIPLDRVNMPTYNFLMRKAKSQGDPVRGGFRFNVKASRGQKLTWWDGMDMLPFEERYTGDAMRFYVGKFHFGDVMPFDFVERTGVRVDYNKGITQGGRSKATLERVVNVIKENADDIKYNIQYEMAKTIMKANTDNPKAFIGIDGLMPASSATAGTIGGLSRSNPLFQHRVATGWDATNILSNFTNFITLLERRAGGKKIDYIACGDNAYELLLATLQGSQASGAALNTQVSRIDSRMARDQALKAGEKYNIALPQDCLMYNDILIVRDPMFEELHREDPTAGWLNRIYFIQSDSLFLVPVMNDVVISHPMPTTQRVQYTSYHGELSLALTMPNCCGVATISSAFTPSGFFG